MADLEARLDKQYYKDYYKSLTEGDRLTALEILKKYEGRGVRSSHPRIILTAGAMTSGKSTVLDKLVDSGLIDRETVFFLDPDEFKKQIPGYLERAKKMDRDAGTQYHVLSMYIVDILTGWLLLQQKSLVYITSLRFMPSGSDMIERIKRDHPSYRTAIAYVRSPITTLEERNQERFERTGRLVPPLLLKDSVMQVEKSVWHLEPLADDFLIFANDQNRNPRLIYHRNDGRVMSESVEICGNKSCLPSLHENLSEAILPIPHHPPSTSFDKPIDILLDIDWTLTYLIMTDISQDFIKYRRERYRPTDGIAEFITVLTSIAGVRLSMVSGGLRERNEEVLRQIKMPDGSNLFERVYRIISGEDLEEVSKDMTLKFSQRYKKNYKKAAADIDLARALALDDQIDIAFTPEQNESIIWLQRTFNFIEDFNAMTPESLAALRLPPDSKEAWALERYKLAWSLGVILQSIENAKASGTELRAEMKNLIRNAEGHFFNREHPSQFKYYIKGAEAMGKVNPTWAKAELPTCAESINRLQKLPEIIARH